MNNACISYWFPKLSRAVSCVPQTEILKTKVDLTRLLDGHTPKGWHSLVSSFKKAAQSVGGYPVFLRTGVFSGKHDYKASCFVGRPSDFPSHIAQLVELSHFVDIFGLPHDVWAVRQYLRLETGFTAFRGFPVNRERRYFIKDGVVLCHHPYWPPDSIEMPDDPNWKRILERLNTETADEIHYLTEMSEKVSNHIDGAWSLDWACDKDGKWWAIDMAPAAQSFHWSNCERGVRTPLTGD